ncbi:MAG TPA: 50S ribosomal protein L20 [Acidimicrobiia bacterium]|nr:50S ribosomal protein L20 [Acidimicrobiia bacterium]
MARVKRSVHAKKGRKAILANAKGYRGARHRTLRAANEAVMKAGQYAYRDRRAKKGEFRRLWIVRINAACRLNDISYSQFIAGLKSAEIDVDRKILAELAVNDPATFASLVTQAQAARNA